LSNEFDLKFSKKFKKNFIKRMEKYDMHVGILQDKPYRVPLEPTVIGSYAGGPIRKASMKKSGLKLSEISQKNRENLGFNYLTEPFKNDTTELKAFKKQFFYDILKEKPGQRLKNALQAVVRNPILRGDYGKNTLATEAIKTFNRYMIDTGQLFKNLKAMIVRKK
jgi:hypothetical protein